MDPLLPLASHHSRSVEKELPCCWENFPSFLVRNGT
jgi:hypothetical protein